MILRGQDALSSPARATWPSMPAEKAQQLGAKVVAMSDSTGWIYDEKGIDLDAVKQIKEVRARTHQGLCQSVRPQARVSPRAARASGPCPVTSPCPAPPRTSWIWQDAAGAGGQWRAWQWARAPTCPPPPMPLRFFQKDGVLFAPGKASNAGGVATCGLEMSQNSHASTAGPSRRWTRKLKEIMKGIFHAAYTAAEEYGCSGDLIAGANIAGFLKVAESMKAQGIAY